MAKRRSKEQIQADKLIKKQLLILGEKVWEEATETSRVAKDTYRKDGKIKKAGGTLRDSQNFRPVKDTTLEFAQVYYGAFNYPKGKNSGEKNALLIAIKNNIPKATKIIVSDLTSRMIEPFKK